MNYEGLTDDDLVNVRALNRAWLRLDLQDATRLPRLSGKRLERLASAPFLLFSLQEHDERKWLSLLDSSPQKGLLDELPDAAGELIALQSAGLAFLWELARRNPYVARLVTGAPLHWCEQVAAATLVCLLDRTARCQIIQSRFASAPALQRRLWRRGGSALREMRLFAQIVALQSMLTNRELVPYRRMPAAACRMPQSAQEVTGEV